jgi:hypothetical protein
LDELHLLVTLRCLNILTEELLALLVRRESDLVLEDTALVLLVLVHFGTLGGRVVDVVALGLFWSKQAGRWNVKWPVLVMLLGVRYGPISFSAQIVQVSATLGILGFRSVNTFIHIRLELLVSVKILNHQVQIVFILI